MLRKIASRLSSRNGSSQSCFQLLNFFAIVNVPKFIEPMFIEVSSGFATIGAARRSSIFM